MAHVSARVRLAVAAVLVAPALAACSDDPPSASPPPSTSSSPTESASPSGPPTLPAAAKGTTPEAAEAFVRHYVDLINYATRTLDTAAMEAASTPGCETCNLIFKIARTMRSEKRTYEGGEWVIEGLEELPGRRNHRQVRALLNIERLRVVMPSGKSKSVAAHQTAYVFDLVERRETWAVDRMVGRS